MIARREKRREKIDGVVKDTVTRLDCRRLVERERKRRSNLSSVSAWQIFAAATNEHSSPWLFPGPVRAEEMNQPPPCVHWYVFAG